MGVATDQEIADRLTRRRARLIPMIAILFLAGQVGYFSGPAGPMRTVDTVRISAWLVWAIALLILLATGGGYFRSKAVRALLNDETTREHRGRALAAGFWGAMLACVVMYFLSAYEPVTSRESIHLVLTVGIAMALIRFGQLERRALASG